MIVGLIVGITVALIIVQFVLNAQNNLENAGLHMTKLPNGLLSS